MSVLPTPRRRDKGLIVRPAPDGGLISHDIKSKQTVSIDADAATVFQAIDGKRDVAGIAAATGLTVGAVETELSRLDEADLLDDSQRGVFARRTLIIGGVSLAAIPLMAIPAPAVVVSGSHNPTVVASGPGTYMDPAFTSPQGGEFYVSAMGFKTNTSLVCTPSDSGVSYGTGYTHGAQTVVSSTGAAAFYFHESDDGDTVTFSVTDGTSTVVSNSVKADNG